jgi:pilus assembly protein CpaE
MSSTGGRPSWAGGPLPIADARFCKTLLICPHRATLTDVVPLLGDALPLAPMQKLHAYPDRKQITELLRTFDAKLCFLDFATSADSGLATMEVLHAVSPGLMVVALLSGNNPDLVLHCLRTGAADFLVAPFTADQVEAVIEKVARRIPAADGNATPARLTAVIPAKGGVGASTIAVNLAFQCKRVGARRVLLADFDALTGSISFLLKVKSTYSFLDVLHHAGGLDADIWKQMAVPLRGIDVLLAPDSVVDPTADLLTATPILDFTRMSYDVIVADCGGVEGDWNLSIAKAADQVLLVTSNELPDLHATQRALAYLDANGVEADRVRVVVNRYSEANGLGKDRIGVALGREVFQTLALDEQAVEQAQMDGKPIPASSPVAKSLASLATQVLNGDNAAAAKAKTNGGGLFSMFSRS